MPTLNAQRGQSLQLLMTALISALVLVSTLSVGFFYYRALQEQQRSAQARLFNATTQQIQSNINEYKAKAIAAISITAQSGVVQTYSQEERSAYIPQMVSVLKIHPSLQAVYLGYLNGDFFLVRRLDDVTRHAYPEAPPATRWIVQYANQNPRASTEQALDYLDNDLISTQPRQYNVKRYDPRQRPWYLLAKHQQGPIGTHPYRFSSTGLTGITYAIQSPDETAIAGIDIRLTTLRDVLKNSLPTPRAQMALINSERQVLVTSDVAEDAKVPLPLADFPSPALAALGLQWLKNNSVPKQFRWNDQSWLVSLSALNPEQPGGPQLLMVMPEDELFADGERISKQAIWIPLIILLIMLPTGWMLSRIVSTPLRRLVDASGRIQYMDFSDSPMQPTTVRELNELMAASESMKETIRDFIGLSQQIVSENDLEPLLTKVLNSAMRALPARRAALWLLTPKGLQLSSSLDENGQAISTGALDLNDPTLKAALDSSNDYASLSPRHPGLPEALKPLRADMKSPLILLPLKLESQELLGLLVLSGAQGREANAETHHIRYLQALSSFAAIAIDNRRLASALKQLMNGLVELVAGAIDAKSPYTGGHCQRVPDLAQALAEAAHQQQTGPFARFHMNEADREALYIASWLHDCGKVTTPEYVVDKATKLETLYDRIHEIRTRFEVLKRDADIAYWQGLAAGGDDATLRAQRDACHAQLDNDFAFVARCNQGGEFIRDDDLARLKNIAKQSWLRTLDDRLGLGPLEKDRLAAIPATTLPTREYLLADKPEHCIHRSEADILPANNPWGFRVKEPELLYNKGEIYNLAIRRGTLTEEERYKINAHITETIKMLHALPLPSHLLQVPEIAGGHHERMDGKGYPRGLHGKDMSVMARIMAIADVFEALTAADRPYKQAKTLSEALTIMQKMAEEGHIDPVLYQLFIESDVWHDYARRYLDSSQADINDATPYLPRQPMLSS